MDNIILHLIDHPDAPNPQVAWYGADTATALQKEMATLDEFARIHRERFPEKAIIAILSGQYLTYMRVPVTVKNQRQMLQALPFLVEEQVIGNIEDMHIATPEKIVGDSIRIAIVDRELLDKIRLSFASHGLALDAVFSLPDLLSCASGELHILLSQQVACAKSAAYCFECDADSLETLLDTVSLDGITTLVLSFEEHDKQAQALAASIKVKLSTEALETRTSPYSGDPLPFLLAASPKGFADCLNILQGEFSSTSPASQMILKYLPVAWVALLCLFLQVGFNIAAGLYFHRYADRIEQNLSARYLALFPEETRVVDLEAQLKGKLASSHLDARNAKFPLVFATAINVMNKTGNIKEIHLKQFRYDEDSGELKMGLEVSSIALLDKIKKGLVDLDYVVDIVSANDEDDLIKATLSIKHS